MTSKPVLFCCSIADSVGLCKFVLHLNITAAPCADPEGGGDAPGKSQICRFP